jgi:NADH-quinone oxidoreductase subunit N
MLYGISILYGLTGTIDLAVMGRAAPGALSSSLAMQMHASPLPVAIAVVMVLAGFAVQDLGRALPLLDARRVRRRAHAGDDVLAVASKAAGFGALLRFVGALFLKAGTSAEVEAYGARIGLLLAILAAITMTLGNLAAMRQQSLKRMLAYSVDRARGLRADRRRGR